LASWLEAAKRPWSPAGVVA